MRVLLPLLSCISLLLFEYGEAQRKSAFVSGRILDENENPLPNVTVLILGRQAGTLSSDSGMFRIKVPADEAFALVFTFAGYNSEQRNFLLNENEEEKMVLRMEHGSRPLQEVTVRDLGDRGVPGLIRINPKDAINIPSPTGGIESLIKVFVGSNNELTSQYSVRGGNYDENLIYVNDFEIFRPYLVSNAQQEGLSAINPELTKGVSFYNGGFQAKYGDKMSSVLDIQYRKPAGFGGSVYIGLLEQGLHLEGTGHGKKFSYLLGVRNRSNKILLSSQDTKGNYIPSSADIQALFTYAPNPANQLELMGTLMQTKFSLVPQFSELSSSVLSPYFTANLALDISFNGQEADAYRTNLLGITWTRELNPKTKLKWMASHFEDNEKETNDITGNYLFGERDFDKSSPTYGLITNPLGAGIYQTFARDQLDIGVWNFTHKGSIDLGPNFLQWGVSAEDQRIHDKLHEWQLQDSAGYSIPYAPTLLDLSSYQNATASLEIGRFTGFLQDNFVSLDSNHITIQGGLRFNYNTLNHQFLASPRASLSWKPRYSRKDIVYHASLGIYDQPPFYRELRRPDGTLNENLLAQRSWQVSAGLDYNFTFAERPFRLTSEAYYKGMTDVDPYDIDNVRISYFGNNEARAFAAGAEMRLFGELVKDAESWISLGILRTREKIAGAYYYDYTLDSLNRPVDSIRVQQGWVRRPTDRLITLGMFIQDYLATNKNLKVYLNFLYGSNLPYNLPGSIKYRNALIIDPYIRIDLGFSALLLDSEKSRRGSHSPFRNFENIWATLEVFNVIDRDNTISYLLIKDFSNTTYAMPQRLTPRLINLKLVARF